MAGAAVEFAGASFGGVIVINMPRLIYKTLLDTFDQCDRKGYLRYFFLGNGVEAGARGSELSIGVAIHKGVEALWGGASVPDAIAQAHLDYEHDVVFPDGTSAEIIAAVRAEQRLVIQAVVTLFSKTVLKTFLEQYEHVSSEEKIIVPLTPGLSLYARPDAVIRSKVDNRLFNFSLKTEKSHNRIKHPAALIDTGGLTESVTMAATAGGGDLKSIGGTIMCYLVVGTMDDDEIIIWNPLIHGWSRPSPTGLGGREYAWRWKFPNLDYNPAGPKSSAKNPENRSLAKKDGWERFNAADYPGGLDAWIEDLIAQKFVPHHMNPVDELVFVPPVYSRTLSAVSEFLEETIAEQTSVTERVEAVEAGTLSLAKAFPKRRGNCLRYGERYRCEMWGICFEGAGLDPLNQGYRKRMTSSEREAARKDKV